LFTHLDFKVWINREMFRLSRAIFQGERVKNADVFALFPPAIRFFSDVTEIVGLNQVPLEQAVLFLTVFTTPEPRWAKCKSGCRQSVQF
jgi:hypothetical protein